MNEAVFISDLHLHPAQPAIMEKFRQFVSWAANNTRSIYILGDFCMFGQGMMRPICGVMRSPLY